MTVDYGNAVVLVTEPRSYKITGVNIGSMYLPLDLIKQVYEKVYLDGKHLLEYGQCRPIPDKEHYEYYQWDGNAESIKNVPFLKDITDNFRVGGKGFGRYHLDYQEQDGVFDIYPGDYIVNKPDEYRSLGISIYRKDDFEKKFIYK